MAYYATMKIKHGTPTEKDPKAAKHFKAGDKVEGLPKEDMKQLWDAGALRKGDASDAEEAPEGGSTETGSEGTKS